MTRTARLGKTQEVCPSFKGDQHRVIGGIKINKDLDLIKLNLYLSDNSVYRLTIDDFRQTEARYEKKNIDIPARTSVSCVIDTTIESINKKTVTHPIVLKEKPEDKKEVVMEQQTIEEIVENDEPKVENEEVSAPVETPKQEKKEQKSFEQISIFDIDDDE